jgi:hypothetical protein
MPDQSNWNIEFLKEIEQARISRQSGNEGRARVCARRAAGIAAGEYLSQIQPDYQIKGALENLTNLQSHLSISKNIKDSISLFIIHVDYEHNLPVDVDLIEKAVEIRDKLLTTNEQSNE